MNFGIEDEIIISFLKLYYDFFNSKGKLIMMIKMRHLIL